MSETPRTVRRNVEAGRVRVSQHAMQELPDDGIDLDAVVTGVAAAVPIEDYPDYVKGPCVLCLQKEKPVPYAFFGAAPKKPLTLQPSSLHTDPIPTAGWPT